MFKSLRDRLKGVSKQLEDEIESQLGDQLEAELAAELEQEASPEAVAESVPEPTPASTPVPDAVPGPASEPTPEPVSEPEPEEEVVAESAPEPTPQPSPESTPEPSPEPTSEPSPEPAPKPAPEQAPEPAPEPAPIAKAATQMPPMPEQPKAKPAEQPITGRKMFTEDEIEARLQRELDAAVEIQKDVEQVAAPSRTSKFTINEQVLEDILWELELALLESDVALPVIEAIKESVKEQLLSLSISGRPEEVVEKVLRTAIKRVLSVNPIHFDEWLDARLKEKKPVVLMFVGVNGTGKTTSIGRIAHRLKEKGISCVMAAGDTFRAGAIEQLALHGERLGIKVVKHTAGADPAAVAYDAIEHAKARHKDVVLLDTAGRMQNNTNLMDEMDKIRRVANPDLCIFVGDSLAGNDAVEQARRFDEVVDIGGAILTKVDVDAKGGAALSVAYTINKPLLFLGVGQEYPDLKLFDAEWLVDRLFGGEGAN